MKRRKRTVSPAVPAVLSALALLLLLGSAGFYTEGPAAGNVTLVERVAASVDGGARQQISLPHSFKGLQPRTPVTLTARITPDSGDCLYIKSVYSPAKIYLDGRLVHEFGRKENYPRFMADPGTEIYIIETQGAGRTAELRMEFLSPVSRSTMTVHPPRLGASKELLLESVRRFGVPLVFSLAQILGGLALILISALVMFIDRKGGQFLYLGLFSLLSGAWGFGENNFSGLLIKRTAFLYLLSFIGLFAFIVPLLRFARTYIDFEAPGPLRGMELFAAACASLALLLQLTGLVSFSKSMYFFHALLPLMLLALACLTVREAVKRKNVNAGRLALPVCVLALTSFLELLNYQLPFTYSFSSLFQAGTLFFLLFMGIAAALTLRDSVDMEKRQKELDFEKKLMEIQLKEQKKQSLLLSQHERLLSRQRHDLRHQLTALRELAGDGGELVRYIDTLIAGIPTARRSFCENEAVNAVVSHYASLCEKQGIELSVRLTVPEKTQNVSDSALCAIFGNLLENAAEACGRMEQGRRFIRLRSSLHYELLTVTMDNSFDGRADVMDGRFLSSKRSGFGIGLESVKAIAEAAGGGAEFKTEGRVFLSSVYVRI